MDTLPSNKGTTVERMCCVFNDGSPDLTNSVLPIVLSQSVVMTVQCVPDVVLPCFKASLLVCTFSKETSSLSEQKKANGA